MKPTAVIVDDDAMARERLVDLVASVPLVRVLGEASDGDEAIELIDRERPDIAFLDIEMPACSGLEVVQRVRHAPAVVFTTAYDRYAITAFELAAVDYLQKPFDEERFAEALRRAVAAAKRVPRPDVRAQAAAVIDAEEPLTRLFLRDRDAILPVPVGRISRFEANGDYVLVHVGDRSHLVRLRLQDLEDRLAGHFLRVHRSHLVNLDHVKVFEPADDARLVVVMADGSRILASRSRSSELRKLAR